MTREETYSRFEELDRQASQGGGAAKIEKQHAAGHMTARERIDMLLDKGTFCETDKLVNHRCTRFGMEKKQIPGDGVVCGYGKIDGRLVFVYAYDFTVHGGSLSETNAAKIVKVQQQALKCGAPIIGLNDSGGARIQEGICSLAGYASIFYQNTMASGVVPQLTAILGPCAGGACYSPALTDFIFMVNEKSHMFITGPDVVKAVTNEEVGKEELGGAYTHSTKSGVAHFMADSEEETLMRMRELLSFLPSNNMEDAPIVPCTDDANRTVESLQTVVPEDPNQPYDIKDTHSRTGVILSLIVAFLIIILISDPFKGLIYSQMALSIQLPITVFTQVYLTSSEKVMGKFRNSTFTKYLLYTIGIVVTVLNLMLLWSFV